MTDVSQNALIQQLDNLTDEQLRELYGHLAELEELQQRNPLDFFEPYEPQKEFFAYGTSKRERLFMAGNQTGKSTSGAFETACHLTGNYPPEWWTGKRYNKPTTGWACGQSGTQIRETIQLKLVGMRDAGEPSGVTGGLVPKHLVIGYTLSHGTGDLFDTVKIRHISGGLSVLSFKSYEQDSQKWQGQTIDFCWIDEECPPQHYAEALARLTGQGIMYVTFTPLLGFSEVVARFLRETDQEKLRDRVVVKMGIKHVTHYTEEEKRQRINSYPQHEREARENGDPVLGSGAVFTVPSTDIMVSDLYVPLHWCKLWGTDFGVTHPFGAVLIAWDIDADIIYVLDTVRLTNSQPIHHASAIKRIAPDVRVSWPHDGSRRETSLQTITSNYKREGLLMLPTHAAFVDGSISTEAGVLEMQERMADGRFRVRSHLGDWFDEYRSYHRDKEGRLVKIRDDLISATRIALMAKRFARPGPIGGGVGVASTRRVTPRMATNVDFDLFG